MSFKCLGGQQIYDEVTLFKIDSINYGYANNCVDKRIVSSYHHNTLYHTTFIKIDDKLGVFSLFSIDKIDWFLNFKVISNIENKKFFYWCVEEGLFHKENLTSDYICLKNLNVICNVMNEFCERCGVDNIQSKGNSYAISKILTDKRFTNVFNLKTVESKGTDYEVFQRVYYN